jgi:flagellar basal-body rod modification protein FlgD
MTTNRAAPARRCATIAAREIAPSVFSFIRLFRADESRMAISAGTSALSSSLTPNQLPNKSFALKSEDFIKMMITQLQNQDPLEPEKNDQLLAQMSQIGQLQASTDLQSSLKSLVLQNNVGTAGNLIGKTVHGLDDKGAPLSGIVNSVSVQDGAVGLELDNGKRLALDHVTGISAPAKTQAATSSATSSATKLTA